MRPTPREFHRSAAIEQFSEDHEWRKRLQKVHSQGRRSLPAKDGSWRELDSSLSSDALLMNIFCYPGVTRRREVCRILGLEPGSVPEFGFMPRVPLLSEATERTEIDMKLGNKIFEAKLTEGDFQIQRAELVEGYQRSSGIFECRHLPRTGAKIRLVSAHSQCARGSCARPRFLHVARRSPAGLAGGLVRHCALHTIWRLFALDARC